MKVVLFCGGLGMRLREYADNVPKPMVPIGTRPILWHIMKYYAHFGHKEFVLCLGYRGDAIKNFFLNYEECLSNDFVLSDGGRTKRLLHSDIDDWRITFVDTGLHTNIGERLMAVRDHLEGEDEFLANYSDAVTDHCLPEQIEHLQRHDRIASFLSVRPNLSYHFVTTNGDGEVTAMQNIAEARIRVNGGFFVFRKEIFDYIREREDLVLEPFQRLIRKRQLLAHEFDNFWVPMDTAKDKKRLDDMDDSGVRPWEIWNRSGSRSRVGSQQVQEPNP